MKHITKVLAFLFLLLALWISILRSSALPHPHSLLFPLYLVAALGFYGVFMVAIGLLRFPTCEAEARLLAKDIAEAKAFLKEKGVDINSYEES